MHNDTRKASKDGVSSRTLMSLNKDEGTFAEVRPGGETRFYWLDPTPISLKDVRSGRALWVDRFVKEVIRRGGEPLRVDVLAFRPLDMLLARDAALTNAKACVTTTKPPLYEFRLHHERKRKPLIETHNTYDLILKAAEYCPWPEVLFTRAPYAIIKDDGPWGPGSRIHLNPLSNKRRVGTCTDPLGRTTQLTSVVEVDWTATLLYPTETLVEALAEFILETKPTPEDLDRLKTFAEDHGVRPTDVTLQVLAPRANRHR